MLKHPQLWNRVGQTMGNNSSRGSIDQSLQNCTTRHLILLLQNHKAFDDNKINTFKQNIIQYIENNQINGAELKQTPRKTFSVNLIQHMNGNKRIRGPANKTWDRFHKLDFNTIDLDEFMATTSIIHDNIDTMDHKDNTNDINEINSASPIHVNSVNPTPTRSSNKSDADNLNNTHQGRHNQT